MSFWQVLLIFAAIAAVAVLWPFLTRWFRNTDYKAGRERVSANTRLYEEHLAELHQLRDNGDISQEEFQTLKLDQQRALLEDAADSSDEGYRSGGWIPLAVIAVLVPLAALWAYRELGSRPDWEIQQLLQEWQVASEPVPALEAELREKLTRRLQNHPENTQNWYLLAKLALNVQDFDQAVAAYQEIVTAEPESPRMLAELAQAQFLQAGNTMTEEVRRNTRRALAIDPDMPTALGLAGIDAFQQGEFQQAIEYWSRAVELLGQETPGSRALVNGIARAQAELMAQGKPVEQVKPEAEPDIPTFTVEVSLAEGVEVAPEATVFVYARAFKGPRMPLAIERFPVDQLPKTVQLDSTMGMIPNMSLDDFNQFEVVARVSPSGEAVAQSGDWQATQGPVALENNQARVTLTISEQLP